MAQKTKSIPPLLTVRSIGEYFEVEPHRINYIVRSRGIKPTVHAGVLRVFNVRDLDAIAKALAEAEATNGGGSRINREASGE